MSIYSQDIPSSPEPQNNLTAVVMPGASDDVTKGYTPGSMWCNTAPAPKQMYECIDATEAAAVWVSMSGAGIGGGLPSIPGSGQYQITNLYLDADMKIVVQFDDVPIP